MNVSGLGVQLELRRRIRLPGMGAAVPLAAPEVLDSLATGRVQVAGPVPVPVPDRRSLEDLAFFAGAGAAVPAHGQLATALVALSGHGWTFHGARGEQEGEVGAFGAYRNLTGGSFLNELYARRGDWKVALSSPNQVESWAASCQTSPLAAQAGPEALTVSVRELLEQKRYGEAASLAELQLGEPLAGDDAPVRATLGLALIEFPGQPLEAARRQLEVSSWQEKALAARSARQLIQRALPEHPLTGILGRDTSLGIPESEYLFVRTVLAHLEEPDLRKVGLEAIRAQKDHGYFVQAAELGAAFAQVTRPPELDRARDVLPRLSEHDSRTAVYRAVLSGSPDLFARILADIHYGADGVVVARHALAELEGGPAVEIARRLLESTSLGDEAKQAAAQAVLESPQAGTPVELARVGLRAMACHESRRHPNCQDTRALGLAFLRPMQELPAARLALKVIQTGSLVTVPAENALLAAVLERVPRGEVDADLLEGVFDRMGGLDRIGFARALRRHHDALGPELQRLLNDLPETGPGLDQDILSAVRAAREVRTLADPAVPSGIDEQADAVLLSQVRLKKRRVPVG